MAVTLYALAVPSNSADICASMAQGAVTSSRSHQQRPRWAKHEIRRPQVPVQISCVNKTTGGSVDRVRRLRKSAEAEGTNRCFESVQPPLTKTRNISTCRATYNLVARSCGCYRQRSVGAHIPGPGWAHFPVFGKYIHNL